MEVQGEHGQDGADLDDHQEQRKELRGNLELHEIVDEDHMARRRDGQPFGDALDDAYEEGLQRFNDHVLPFGEPFTRERWPDEPAMPHGPEIVEGGEAPRAPRAAQGPINQSWRTISLPALDVGRRKTRAVT